MASLGRICLLVFFFLGLELLELLFLGLIDWFCFLMRRGSTFYWYSVMVAARVRPFTQYFTSTNFFVPKTASDQLKASQSSPKAS